MAIKAAGAISAGGTLDGFFQLFKGQISERIQPQEPADILHGLSGADELLLIGRIDAEVAGEPDGR